MLPLERQNQLRQAYRQAHPGWQPASEHYAALVRQHLHPGLRLLDLGCGRGGLVEQLDYPLGQITGLDPDLASLRQHRLPRLPRVQAQSAHLPLPAASVDLVMASWVLEHLARPEQDFRQVGRVLKPGGHFLFLTPNRAHPLIALNRLFGRVSFLQKRLVAKLYGRAGSDTFPAFYRANSASTLRRLGRQAGLELASLRVVADPTYWAAMPALFPLLRRLDAALPRRWQLHLVGAFRRPRPVARVPDSADPV